MARFPQKNHKSVQAGSRHVGRLNAANDKQQKPAEKTNLHPRNKHRSHYDFDQLVNVHPSLGEFVQLNVFNDASIDFSNPKAVKTLNQALLKQFYGISEWDIPALYLCPPIPGRADYLHYIADLLTATHASACLQGESIRGLDIGVGANTIYPLIGHREYDWHFVGADIDQVALANAQRILDDNGISSAIELRLQSSSSSIFNGVVKQNELFDFTMCNPPFHTSLAEAKAGTKRKWQNLAISSVANQGTLRTKNESTALNFGGQATELYCVGGEEVFIGSMIRESQLLAKQCVWFTTLVSKASSLPNIYRALKSVSALEVKTIEMAQGQKKSRIVAWTFLNASQQHAWYSLKK